MTSPTRSTSYFSTDAAGQVAPRLATPPLRELTEETSYGFEVVWFARDVLKMPLDPWQEQLVIRLGELLEDGTPRFRQALVVVARQNGKTHLCLVLTLYWLFLDLADTHEALVLSTSTTVEYAKEPWQRAVDIATSNPALRKRVAGIGRGKGSEELKTTSGGRYKIAASNSKGGRGLSIDRLIIDELREHKSFDAWNAAEPTTTARRGSQIVCITNQGDETAVVLDSLRLPALDYIRTGNGDPRLGLFEWSAPPELPPDSWAALAHANPNMGHRIDPDVLMATAKRAVSAGGEELAGFRTERLCQRVELLDPAIDPESWRACANRNMPARAGGGYAHVLCLDVARDGSHATLVAASPVGRYIHTEVVAHWEGFGAPSQAARDIPGWVERIRPRAFVWFPGGPAARIAADLSVPKSGKHWLPAGVKPVEIRAEQVTQACMGLAEHVIDHSVMHADDDLLGAHVMATAKKPTADGWVFDRRGTAPIDAAYALAGAVHAARTLPRRVQPVAY